MKEPLVVVAGGSSAAGIAVARALLSAGMRVVTVGSDVERVRAAARLAGGAIPFDCDLSNRAAVAALGEQIRGEHGPVDGLVHLVGGWRGGGTLPEQNDADWDFLHQRVLTTLRHTSREFLADLTTSAQGRLLIVSSTSVTTPTPRNANYASVKAAAETWVQAVAAGFTQTQSAAVIFVVKALVDDAMRARFPERTFPGFTDVAELGRHAATLFSTPAVEINGARITLPRTQLT